MAYEAYKAYLSVAKTNVRDAISDEYKQQIINGFFDSPSYYQVQIYTASTPLSSTPVDSWIVDDPSKTKEVKQIQLMPNQVLNYGDLVLWQGDRWLTTVVDYMGGIYYRGSMQKCYSSLKWQDETLTTKEAYFIVTKDTQRGLGIVDGKVMLLPDERRFIAVQNNVDTLKIVKGQRFILDNNRCFRVTSMETLETGMIQFELEEQEIDTSKDNVALRICNYVTPTINPTGTLYLNSTTSPIDQIKVTANKIYQSMMDNAVANVTWSLYGIDKVSATTLVSISSFDAMSCVLKAGSVSGGSVQLKATLQSDASKIVWQQIDVVGLI